ncbi:MAG TPA: D-2-hydroxyacid dehydrogenase [Acidimicrobiales bacterium]
MADGAGTVVTILSSMVAPEAARARLEAVAPGVEVHAVPYRESAALRNARATGRTTAEDRATAPVLSDADWAVLERTTAVLALDLPEGLVERATALRWVQLIGAGADHLDLAALAGRGVVVTNASGVTAAPIAEFVLGRLLQVWKHLREVDGLQRARRWEPRFGRRVAGLTLGVVGLGAIGRATARRARAFDMQVLATRRRAGPGDTDPDVDELLPAAALDEMLGRCDAVVIAAPATAETKGLFDAGRIARMKPGAVLCNVARGSLVDQAAVVAALESGHLGAAVLDVTDPEPAPPDSPLWTAANCYLSAHTAVSLEGYDEAVLDLMAANLARFLRGEPLANQLAP